MRFTDIPHTSKRRLGLRVYESGEIVITAPLARKMKITEGEGVKLLFCDVSKSRELFLTKSDRGVKTKLRRKGTNTVSLRLYSKEYANALLNGAKKGIFRIGETVSHEGQNYFTVIYKKNYAETD